MWCNELVFTKLCKAWYKQTLTLIKFMGLLGLTLAHSTAAHACRLEKVEGWATCRSVTPLTIDSAGQSGQRVFARFKKRIQIDFMRVFLNQTCGFVWVYCAWPDAMSRTLSTSTMSTVNWVGFFFAFELELQIITAD